ncbi:hypothetical protein [Candidatus Nitrotoga sp. BS]|uniref:hypothetical protein n=1 Tax=Candidatus Nitrotoga sp. BS TaxID=2890408 RepID=UPI001EF2411C|nr:hypothetical protein [Candidatus Nitrotoga sp. BS]
MMGYLAVETLVPASHFVKRFPLFRELRQDNATQQKLFDVLVHVILSSISQNNLKTQYGSDSAHVWPGEWHEYACVWPVAASNKPYVPPVVSARWQHIG